MLNHTVKKVIGVLEWLLTIVLVSVVLLLVFTAFDPVKSFHVLRVMSGSMEPTLKVGSVVFVQKVNPETLKKGDIITFASTDDPAITITHRLAATEKIGSKTIFKTKGDANSIGDTAEIYATQIKGRVIFSLPYLGYFSVWIKRPLGFGLMIIFPAILIILSEIFSIKKSIEKEVQKRYEDAEKKRQSTIINSLLILSLLSISLFQIKTTSAYFSDSAVISGTTFSAGIWVTPTPTPTTTPTVTPTPTPTPTATPTPTPTLTPTPTPGHTCTGTIIQNNSLNSHTTVISNASTGNNTIDGSTGGLSSITTGDASASAIVITTGGNNTIICQ
jgi:signal peptidase